MMAKQGGPRKGELMRDGDVLIASITSCTNTSNPSVMMAAGLLAKKAVERGLRPNPNVKTSLAPGSRAVTTYLEKAGLLPFLEALGFHVVGYGCLTCIGNSGPTRAELAEDIVKHDLTVAAPSSRATATSRVGYHPTSRRTIWRPRLGSGLRPRRNRGPGPGERAVGNRSERQAGVPEDLWPTAKELRSALRKVTPAMYRKAYPPSSRAVRYVGFRSCPKAGETFVWDPSSTYIRKAPFFEGMSKRSSAPQSIKGARTPWPCWATA